MDPPDLRHSRNLVSRVDDTYRCWWKCMIGRQRYSLTTIDGKYTKRLGLLRKTLLHHRSLLGSKFDSLRAAAGECGEGGEDVLGSSH